MAYSIRAKKKNKGADKGCKYTYTKVWSDRMTRREYLNRMAEIDRRECGLFMCKMEWMQWRDDRWWDNDTYREENLRYYRSTITSIRKEYGLTSSDVKQYMKL